MSSKKKVTHKIVLIGAGRLATHLGLQLKEQGCTILQVYSRTAQRANTLSKKLTCKSTNDLKKISSTGTLYIIAVSDSAIESVAGQLAKNKRLEDKLFVHTSGATPSTILKPYFKNYGGFYPLQTFSANRSVDFSTIPICIDARYVKHKKELGKLAELISNKVHFINEKQRAVLHIAAVFVNNFSNHMFAIAEQIVSKEDISFDLLRPLLLETALKVQTNSPTKMQTGPAVRKDKNTLLRHLLFLKHTHPEFASIYHIISESIQTSET